LAIEIRAQDAAAREYVSIIDDPSARATTTCERAVLQRLGGGCQVPIGASADFRQGRLHLEGVVSRPDGSEILRESAEGNDPLRLGSSVAESLLQRGAARILATAIA
jgi:hydroxymethylbilane synthase